MKYTYLSIAPWVFADRESFCLFPSKACFSPMVSEEYEVEGEREVETKESKVKGCGLGCSRPGQDRLVHRVRMLVWGVVVTGVFSVCFLPVYRLSHCNGCCCWSTACGLKCELKAGITLWSILYKKMRSSKCRRVEQTMPCRGHMHFWQLETFVVTERNMGYGTWLWFILWVFEIKTVV